MLELCSGCQKIHLQSSAILKFFEIQSPVLSTMFVSYQYYWLTLRFPKNELHFKVTFLLKGRSGIHHFFVHFSAFSPLIPFHSNNQPLLNCLCSDSQFYLIIKYRQNYFVTSILTLQIKLCHLICCRLLLGVLLTVYRYDLSHPSQHVEGSWNWAPVISLHCCVKLYLIYLFIFSIRYH